MLSRTSQYAMRAMLYIAEHGSESPVLAKDIAQQTRIPRQYLSTILRDAVRAGLLKSSRGRGGGFKLARPNHRIRLLDIFKSYEDINAKTGCPFGQARCSDEKPCAFHDHWKPVAEAYEKMLRETTVADLQDDQHRKRPKRR